jgi:hypothetical protein
MEKEETSTMMRKLEENMIKKDTLRQFSIIISNNIVKVLYE